MYYGSVFKLKRSKTLSYLIISEALHTKLSLDKRAYLNSIKKITRPRILSSTHSPLWNLEKITQNG